MKSIDQLDWMSISLSLNERGFCRIPQLLSEYECNDLIDMYRQPIYRNTITMERYRFGKGEYKYFSYPLPAAIQKLRETFYIPLTGIANDWRNKLNLEGNSYPLSHEEFIKACKTQGQHRPTPLILKYEAGGFNTLHQDLYGAIHFPFQIVIVLTQAGIAHTGGELVFTEQIPRAQSKAEVVTPHLGDAIIFTTQYRPVSGTRGYYRVNMKHGVSEVKSGTRYALGIIFHDAE